MARGQQKIQSQQRAAEKAAKLKKQVGIILLTIMCLSNTSYLQQGNSKHDNIKTAMAGLKLSCGVCKSLMPDPKTYKQVEGSFNLNAEEFFNFLYF